MLVSQSHRFLDTERRSARNIVSYRLFLRFKYLRNLYCNRLTMMTLFTGFTCPATIYFKFITKCDKCYYKVRQLFSNYKVRWSVITKCDSFLLQSATSVISKYKGITKCDNFITKCDRYYKERRLLESATVHRCTITH